MTVRIAVCDDDPVVGALMTLDLRAAGFEVDEPLASIEAAAGYFAAETPDVLILDLNMPSGGGLELLGYMRVQGLLDHTRVLMLTGEDDSGSMARAKALGAAGYLAKPIDTNHLLDRISRLLADKSLLWIDDSAAAPAAPAPEPAPAKARKHILSVEDIACTQQLLSLFLQPTDYVVDLVSNGHDALAALAGKRYDAVLLDLRLPDIDGLEVARRARTLVADGAPFAIIALSADVMPHHVAEALAAGVDVHLAKPFTSVTLKAALERCWAVGARRLEDLNPTVAELTKAYGEPAVQSLLNALVRQLATLEAADAPIDELESAAHAIRGAAASLGFARVSNACQQLETACKTGAAVQPPLRLAFEACAQARRDIADCLRLAA